MAYVTPKGFFNKQAEEVMKRFHDIEHEVRNLSVRTPGLMEARMLRDFDVLRQHHKTLGPLMRNWHKEVPSLDSWRIAWPELHRITGISTPTFIESLQRAVDAGGIDYRFASMKTLFDESEKRKLTILHFYAFFSVYQYQRTIGIQQNKDAQNESAEERRLRLDPNGHLANLDRLDRTVKRLRLAAQKAQDEVADFESLYLKQRQVCIESGLEVPASIVTSVESDPQAIE